MAIKPTSTTQGLQNARIRFALEGGQVFDYETSRYLPARGEHNTKDGLKFDLAKVAECIRNGTHLERAIVGYSEPPKAALAGTYLSPF